MRLAIGLLACGLLAGCGNGAPSGVYVPIDKQGNVVMGPSGEPALTLTVTDDMAVLKFGEGSGEDAGERKVFKATYEKPLLSIASNAAGKKPNVLRVEGDLLVRTDDPDFRFKKLKDAP